MRGRCVVLNSCPPVPFLAPPTARVRDRSDTGAALTSSGLGRGVVGLVSHPLFLPHAEAILACEREAQLILAKSVKHEETTPDALKVPLLVPELSPNAASHVGRKREAPVLASPSTKLDHETALRLCALAGPAAPVQEVSVDQGEEKLR